MKLPLQPQVQPESQANAARPADQRSDAGAISPLAGLAASSGRSVAQRQLADLAAGSQRLVAQRHLAAIANGSRDGSGMPATQLSAAGTGAPIQCMFLVEGDGRKLASAVKKPATGTVIDTTQLTAQELAVLRTRLASQSDSGALLTAFDREHPAASSGPAPKSDSAEGVRPLDYAEVNAIGEALTAREKMPTTGEKSELDKVSDGLELRINAAYLRLAAITVPEMQSTCRDYLSVYAERLRKLKPDSKAGMAGADGGVAIDHVITAQDRLDYRADIREDGVWGGLAEADVIARAVLREFDIFRIDANQTYRRVTKVGQGTPAPANLLHLGNHYVALLPAAIEGGAADAAHRIETTGDGNCMYEAIAIARHGRALSAEERTAAISRSRIHVATHISDAAIDTSIIGLLSQGSIAGVGSKMHKVVAGEAQKSRVKALTSDALAKFDARYKDLAAEDLRLFGEKRTAYLREREVDPDSKATAATLGELDSLIGMAEAFLSRKSWTEKPKDISLPLDWWTTVQVTMGDTMRDQGGPFIHLANLVGKYNAQAATPVPPFKTMLPLIDEMEDSARHMVAPGGVPGSDEAASREACTAMFRFQNVDLRAARRKLVQLYQFGEGSAFRSGPGNRPEMHYDSYAEGNKAILVTPDLDLAGKGKTEKTLLDSFVNKPAPVEAEGGDKGSKPKAKPEASAKGAKHKAKPEGSGTGAKHKAKQEGLTAIALARKYPDRFGTISAAPHPKKKTDPNVEYYDNEGNPWDQVAPLSFAKGGSPDAMAASVIDHLKDKPFKHRDRDEIVPSGVILDCTYIDEYDYTKMWAILITRASADELRDKVVEINVPFTVGEFKPVTGDKKGTPAAALDGCRGRKDVEEFEIYPLSIKRVATVVTSITTDREKIRDGTHTKPNKDNPVYRNHNNFLPNNNSYFMEFYPGTPGGKLVGAECRLVWDRTNDRLFITPTHYRPWVSPYSNKMRHPFYEIVD
jgi:hypothetical protein